MNTYGILPLWEKQMNRLSSGEARRVLLARAAVHEPEVMLLDEAGASLDFPSRHTYRKSLEQLDREGKTIILATHELSEIIPAIGRVVVMKTARSWLTVRKRRFSMKRFSVKCMRRRSTSITGTGCIRCGLKRSGWCILGVYDTKRGYLMKRCSIIIHSVSGNCFIIGNYLKELMAERNVDARLYRVDDPDLHIWANTQETTTSSMRISANFRWSEIPLCTKAI